MVAFLLNTSFRSVYSRGMSKVTSALELSMEVDKRDTAGGVMQCWRQLSDHFVIECSDHEMLGLRFCSQGSPRINSNSEWGNTKKDSSSL